MFQTKALKFSVHILYRSCVLPPPPFPKIQDTQGNLKTENEIVCEAFGFFSFLSGLYAKCMKRNRIAPVVFRY
jgi:hypothetical protein